MKRKRFIVILFTLLLFFSFSSVQVLADDEFDLDAFMKENLTTSKNPTYDEIKAENGRDAASEDKSDFDKGYDQGKKVGYEQGKKEGYDEGYSEAKKISDIMIYAFAGLLIVLLIVFIVIICRRAAKKRYEALLKKAIEELKRGEAPL